MNYLTNYYKNLSEQLQERVNHLTKLLEASKASDYDDSDLPPKGPTKFSIVDKISGSMHSQSGETSTYLVHGDDGYHYTIAPHYGKAQWAYDNEDLGQAPTTWELGPKQRKTFDIIDRIDNPKNPDHQELIKRYKIEIPETPDYGDDPTTFEDAQVFRHLTGQTRRTPRSRLSEAQLHTPEKIREKEGKGSKRASKREETISAMLGMLQTPRAYPGIDIDTVHRVLRDTMGLEGGNASPDDLKHVMSHIRNDYYSGSSDPEHQKLDAARQRTLNRYG